MSEATDELTLRTFLDRLRRSGRDPERVMHGCPDHALRTILHGQPVRSGLSRTVNERVQHDDSNGDGLSISGHWTVFNSITEIKSWEGSYLEQVLPGATKKTLRDSIPKMQFDHGHHPLLGSLPLGRWTEAKETDRGSWSAGRMADNWLIQPFADAIRADEVNGMSFRFTIKKEKWFNARGEEIKDERELFEKLFWGEGDADEFPLRRDLVEVGVSEAGPVVWPAYQDTDVSARSADGSRIVIDLAAVGERALAGRAVALLDAEMARADRRGPTPPGEDSRSRWQRLGRAELARMADIAAPLGHNAEVTATAVHNNDEPPTTGDRAADHSPPAPHERGGEPESTRTRPESTRGQGTDTPPSTRGPQRPLNPTARKIDLRGRYRDVLSQTLALPPNAEAYQENADGRGTGPDRGYRHHRPERAGRA
jgi:HK97 family phage prohead protease